MFSTTYVKPLSEPTASIAKADIEIGVLVPPAIVPNALVPLSVAVAKLFNDKVFPDDSVAIKSPICYKYLIVNQSTIVCLNNCQSYSFLSF